MRDPNSTQPQHGIGMNVPSTRIEVSQVNDIFLIKLEIKIGFSFIILGIRSGNVDIFSVNFRKLCVLGS